MLTQDDAHTSAPGGAEETNNTPQNPATESTQPSQTDILAEMAELRRLREEAMAKLEAQSPSAQQPEPTTQPEAEPASEPVAEVPAAAEEIANEVAQEVAEVVAEETVAVSEPEVAVESPLAETAKVAEPEAVVEAPVVEAVIIEPTTSETSSEEPAHEEAEEELETEEIAVESLDKAGLLALLEEQLKEPAIVRKDALIRRIKGSFDLFVEQDRSKALKKFVEEGGEADDFDYRLDALALKFDNVYVQYREKRRKHFQEQEKVKEDNLKAKKALIERLRVLVEGEETPTSLKEVKEIQEDWKKTGPVPTTEANTINANFKALMDRFYDRRSIYFELKELDRKKNLEAKLSIAERAEKLLEEPVLNKAVKALNELHEEWKHIGPIPKAEQEALWQRFKASSDTIYKKKREQVELVNQELEQNLKLKQAVLEKAQILSEFRSDRIDDWNKKSQDVLAVEQEWKAINRIPREKAAEINKKFWSYIKTFFATKNQFFKGIEAEKNRNLQMKTELCLEAESLKDSAEWDATTQQLMDLQKRWKAIGPVPNKQRDSIYARFKAALDHFFDRKREQTNAFEVELQNNLKAKQGVIAQLEALAEASEEKIQALVAEFQAIGFVPRKDMQSVADQFSTAVDQAVSRIVAEAEVLEKLKLKFQLALSKGGGRGAAQKVKLTEGALRKKIQQVENQIYAYNNNLSFFANSRNADLLRKEVEGKVKGLEKELASLKEQLKIIRLEGSGS